MKCKPLHIHTHISRGPNQQGTPSNRNNSLDLPLGEGKNTDPH